MIPTTILRNWKPIVVALLVLIAIYLVNKHGRRWWANITRRDLGNYAGQEPVRDNTARQAELQQMAHDALAAMHTVILVGGATYTGREAMLERLLQLNDTELRYVATFYASINEDGTSLKQDVDDEYMPFSSIDEELVGKLNQLAL